MVLRATRNLFTQDVSQAGHRRPRGVRARALGSSRRKRPALEKKIELYAGEEPIFDHFGLEEEIRRAGRKVWLKAAATYFDQAEALTAIDVNTGRYVGKKNHEETITPTNLEAVKEIVYQLRLRNIGGIIIIDFIDMKTAEPRQGQRGAQGGAAPRQGADHGLKISELGLVEMTRKRVRESIGRTMHEACPYCEGQVATSGARVTVCYEIFREIRREAVNYAEPTLVINCHPDVAALLGNEGNAASCAI